MSCESWGDVVDAARMDEVIDGATVVYQLTLEGKWTDGAKNVADACVKHSVRRLVFASTSDALNLSKAGTIYEKDPPDPHPDLRNEYSRGKGESERLLLEFMKQTGLGVVIMRKKLLGWKPNASVEMFVREAIDPYVDPIHPNDLRLSA